MATPAYGVITQHLFFDHAISFMLCRAWIHNYSTMHKTACLHHVQYANTYPVSREHFEIARNLCMHEYSFEDFTACSCHKYIL